MRAQFAPQHGLRASLEMGFTAAPPSLQADDGLAILPTSTVTTSRLDKPEGSNGLPRVGDTIAGKYRVDGYLGAGGMGVVARAYDTTLRRQVAIKLMHPEGATNRDAMERFLREARAVAALRSEHVVQVFEVGRLESETPFLVMDYLTGGDLDALVKSKGSLPVADAVDYVLQACEGVAEAHAAGILHRDLKPANLFLATREGRPSVVKVLDFGLSKSTRGEAGEGVEKNLTMTHEIRGSPHYMSPEQGRSLRHLDARTDVWSLGVVLYYLLSGAHPFEGETATAIISAIAADPPIPLRSRRSDVPKGLEQIVLMALEKRLDARTPTVAAFARALAPFGSPSALESLKGVLATLGEEQTLQLTPRVLTTLPKAVANPLAQPVAQPPLPPTGPLPVLAPAPAAPALSSAFQEVTASPLVHSQTRPPRSRGWLGLLLLAVLLATTSFLLSGEKPTPVTMHGWKELRAGELRDVIAALVATNSDEPETSTPVPAPPASNIVEAPNSTASAARPNAKPTKPSAPPPTWTSELLPAAAEVTPTAATPAAALPAAATPVSESDPDPYTDPTTASPPKPQAPAPKPKPTSAKQPQTTMY